MDHGVQWESSRRSGAGDLGRLTGNGPSNRTGGFQESADKRNRVDS